MAPAMSEYKRTLQRLEREKNELADYLTDDSEDDLETDQPLKQDFKTCLIVDNLPSVGAEKYDKLLGVLTKIFTQFGTLSEEGISMPMKDNMTQGFAFIDYLEAEAAEKARTATDNFKLDRSHIFKVCNYEDIDKYLNVAETYEEPETKPYVEKPDLYKWLEDGRDQVVMRYATETEIHWVESGQPPALDYDGSREKKMGKTWCEQYVMWSPQGTYLATFHKQGIALWGGENWEKMGRFAHGGVRILDFSPQENYMLTMNDTDGEKAIIVWDVRNQKPLRAFAPQVGGPNDVFAPFKWSNDDKYIARMGKDVIQVYELPSMKLLDKKSLKAEGVSDFFWSPKDNLLAYWAPESSNSPARVTLVEIPSRKEIRQKNLFNVADCKLHWHEDGVFLCVKVTRTSKSGKTKYTNFELFRVKEDLVPVEMFEMKDRVVAFSWEPRGTRFALVHGESSQRLHVSFYDMCGGKGSKKNELTLLYTLENKACNHLYWSPIGNFIVLAGLGEMNGALEFWDVDAKNSLAEQEHFKCSAVEWDSSGRIVATSVTQPMDASYYKYSMDNGYVLWTFQGQPYHREKKDNFYQIMFRPRPASLLTPEQYRDVIKNLKKYEKRYIEADKARERQKRREEREAKQRMRREFKALLRRKAALHQERKSELIALRDGQVSDNEADYNIKKSKYDQIIERREEFVR